MVTPQKKKVTIISKDEFYLEMSKVKDDMEDDPEMQHYKADKVLIDALISLGYEKGVNVYKKIKRVYT